MATVSFQGTTRYYAGSDTPAVDGLDLDVADGEFLVLVGPSGCGKTTTLRMLAGLEGVDEGKILIGDVDVTDKAPKDRDIAMVFQNYALYPHMTVEENIGFHLRIQGVPKAERSTLVAEAARKLDLTEYLSRKPAKLSGGQRQRVAMGRAIVRKPRVFCMDEPLSNLDAKLRVQTRSEIASLQRQLEVTTIYVTHDQVEAMTMGDRVAVLDQGHLQQCATPVELYAKPRNVFVAGFIGSPAMNLLPATVEGDGVTLRGQRIAMTPAQQAGLSGNGIVVGVRPEAWEIVAPDEGIAVTVAVVEELGSDAYLYCSTDIELLATETDASTHTITVRSPGMSAAKGGDRIGLRAREASVHLFDVGTGLRLDDA